jgi:hypothetical protein
MTTTNIAENQPKSTGNQRELWLDKLWAVLFDGSDTGLMTPGQIRRENRHRENVRQLEMASILEAEQQLLDVHQGKKSIDDNGNLIDVSPIELVPTHKIIENVNIERHFDIGDDAPASMIRSVVKEISVRDLERSLNIRKIAILAESEILSGKLQPLSNKHVNAEWMLRWREAAESIVHPELQLLLAKTLIAEIAKPESFSLGLLANLQQLSQSDLDMVRLASKYVLGSFIYDATGSYFKADFHLNLFDVLEDLGLMIASSSHKTLASFSDQKFRYLLSCGNKALNISHPYSAKSLTLPVFKLSRIGRQLFTLCHSEADMAYLFDLGNRIKRQGFEVQLGDWLTQEASTTRSKFMLRMSL